MSHHTKLEDNLEGANNFRAWKYKISLVLEENELDTYINEEAPILEGDEACYGEKFLWPGVPQQKA